MISILLPVKNAAPWIAEALASVQLQDYVHWEVLAVDDHSDDESLEIVRQFAAEDARIVPLENDGSGIIPALQLALRHATGTFVTRMDADDCMPPIRLTRFVKALCQHGAGHVVTGRVHYFPEPVSPGYLKYERWLNDRVAKQDHAQHLFRECVLASPNWMLWRSDVDQFRLFDALIYPEDYDLVFRMHAAGLRFVAVDALTLRWREHPSRTSRNSEVYQQQAFFQLKLEWFFRLKINGDQALALFGAGTKGKIVARFLLDHAIPFAWYDIKADKYGAGIFDKAIYPPEMAKEPGAIVCVYPEETHSVEDFLSALGYVIGENAWYF